MVCEEEVAAIAAIIIFIAAIVSACYSKDVEDKALMDSAKYSAGQFVSLKITGEKCQVLAAKPRRGVLKYEIRLSGVGEEERRRDGFVSKSSMSVTVPRSTIWVREFEVEAWENKK